jgi:hypothetical protein
LSVILSEEKNTSYFGESTVFGPVYVEYRARILKLLVEGKKPTFQGKLSFQTSQCTAWFTVATIFLF